jgi:hypothetical protein
VLHETHTFDPVQAAAEFSRYRAHAVIGNVILVLWLISLPLVRQFLGRPVVRKNSVRSRRAVLLHLSSAESRCGGLFPLDLHLDSGF